MRTTPTNKKNAKYNKNESAKYNDIVRTQCMTRDTYDCSFAESVTSTSHPGKPSFKTFDRCHSLQLILFFKHSVSINSWWLIELQTDLHNMLWKLAHPQIDYFKFGTSTTYSMLNTSEPLSLFHSCLAHCWLMCSCTNFCRLQWVCWKFFVA